MAPISPSSVLAQVQSKTKEPDAQLSILRISEPISTSSQPAGSPSKRTSDISADGLDNPTPASLEADLTHYKELFSKLRFSYLEQVTKEKYLRAIVGDPPLIVGHNENVELEAELVQVKEELRGRKEEVRVMVEDIEKIGRDLARRYKKVQLQTSQLSTLPDSIANLESTIAELHASAQMSQANSSDANDSSSSQALPLPATLSLLSERESELANIDRQLASVQAALPRKTREAEGIERELGVLERKSGELSAEAQEAKRRKREGESDGLEEAGRWHRGAKKGLHDLVGVGG